MMPTMDEANMVGTKIGLKMNMNKASVMVNQWRETGRV